MRHCLPLLSLPASLHDNGLKYTLCLGGSELRCDTNMRSNCSYDFFLYECSCYLLNYSRCERSVICNTRYTAHIRLQSSITMTLKPHISQRARRFFQYVIRPSRLQLVAQATRLRSRTETRKTALHSGHRVAALHTLLHLPPFMTCIVLVILNCKTLYIGVVPTAGLTALQFASKLLEILIQASITSITLAYVRQRLLGESAFPLGGLIAPFRVTDLSSLWSLELWGMFTSPGLQLWRKTAASFLIVTVVILAAVVGPSSAVLMIPRPLMYHASSELHLADPMDTIYPLEIALNNSRLRYILPVMAVS